MPTIHSVAISLLMLPLAGWAQEAAATSPISKDASALWGRLSATVAAAAEKMPEENYAFKPSPDVRSFGQLVGHVADAQYMFCAMAKGDTPPQMKVEATKTTKADLVAAIKDSTAFCQPVYAGMTDAKGVEKVNVFGGERTRLTVLFMNAAHDYEHYGNMVTYMRIKGLVPPSSEPRPTPKAK